MKKTGKEYWRSLREDSPEAREWLEREFPGGGTLLDSASRRTLLKLMAASFGLAGLTACSRPAEKILPAAKGVEDLVPGAPLYYSTVMTLGGFGSGLIVEAHDGRPTKVEGNPTHSFSRGAASAFAQASILGLYDPDRMRGVFAAGRRSSWEEFFAFSDKQFNPARVGRGERVRFLSRPANSPSFEAVRAHALAGFPKAAWVEYEPVSNENAGAGAKLAFGRPLTPIYHFERADIVLSLDDDFLGLDAPAVTYLKDFARRRRVASEKDSMNRLYVVESQFSLTGAMADHRLRMPTSDVRDFAAALARELKLLPAGLNVLNTRDEMAKWIAAVARDLERARGRSVVAAGPRQPAEVHALAHWMNHALGNAGRTVTYVPAARSAGIAGLKELAAELHSGQVDTLVVFGGNPAYDAPADLNFAGAMKKAATAIYLGPDANETAALAAWQLPEAHYLEAWGDARALDGTAAIQQPLIEPLFGGKTASEVLAAISGYKDRRGYDIVRNHWGLGEKDWRRALGAGIVPNTAAAPVEAVPDAKRIAAALAAPAPKPSGAVEITFYPSASAWDGRFANNGWLQEAPDPMTKLTWDNAALVSPATAKQLGVASEDVIAIEANGRSIEMPVWVQPGQADGAIALALGYGRSRCGRVGENVGHNVYPLRTTAALHTAFASVRKTGRTYRLATTQEHHSMEGRPLVREAGLEEYRRQPGFAKKEDAGKELFSIYKHPYDYTQGNQWGMVVDLNQCVGCNACVLACQAENNIPIVGKEQVLRGREMHWIRLDRYYTGPEDNPRAVTQPVACQQCENAPCENVCPVAATSHSPEGLNDMAYNRCVGTRYCANNCPYKVRRFNFLDYHKGIEEVEKMAFNPDVTVRMRGVMEKCTYCVQRIQETKIRAKEQGRRAIRDGEIQTACQQTCPAEAITFGNLNDPDSRVARLRKQNRNYALLAELNTSPRTNYLAKLRNPNPELA